MLNEQLSSNLTGEENSINADDERSYRLFEAWVWVWVVWVSTVVSSYGGVFCVSDSTT